ncbi:zinc-binding loop region of homing endonuclease domain-containing protein [Pochonia chlamydosporia 170]|uniref:Zinc-binding loop region of homing endonuclease domain-containing protein n=1 Tax=Pochonia chlamydosporia 170 TaxID=1380566 RepID=A0A179FCF5_METCM|nr:zinc-binding loop region of homing endonuclease domain-containing protein [Pochonia chlamydosporia 170]OAQ62789.1 zinc-binding loop region of homing endonuclease domain-containing protein [Pochonia chlamydosporia 170]
MSRRINYFQELGVARCQDIFTSRHAYSTSWITNDIGCFLFQGSRNQDDYSLIKAKPQDCRHLTGRQGNKSYLLHIIAWISRTQRSQALDQHGNINTRYQISHLCGNRNCFNPQHLHEEEATVNNRRRYCGDPVVCMEHGHELVNLCKHIPRCIKEKTPNSFCYLSTKETKAVWGAGSAKSGQFPSLVVEVPRMHQSHKSHQRLSNRNRARIPNSSTAGSSLAGALAPRQYSQSRVYYSRGRRRALNSSKILQIQRGH